MKKQYTTPTPFFKVLKEHLKLGGNEAILLAYIAEFESQGLDCFASRKRIAEELTWGESTVQRTIKSLLKTGHVTIGRNGWKRLLHTTNGGQNEPEGGSNRTRGGSKMNHQGGSKRTTNLVQNEPIQRSITNNNYKETIQRNKYKEPEPDLCDKMILPLSKEKQMEQKLKEWWGSLSGDERKDLLAQVEAFGSAFERKLCKPDTLTGLSILKKYAETSAELPVKPPQDEQG